MKKNNWDAFDSDERILEHLKSLPRYTNSQVKSLFWRGMFFLNLVACRIFKKEKPLMVVLVTNNACNLNCRYCYGDYGSKKEAEEYSTRELLKIIDELKALGTVLLTVHGGESLIRKDIGEIINYAKLKGFYISLNTNGYLVPKRIEELTAVDTICLSLDGRAEGNDLNRGKGCYQKVIEAIDVIHEYKIPLVVSATLTRSTIGDMRYLAELGAEKGFRVQYSILYNAPEMSEELSHLVLSDKEIREINQEILRLKEEGFPIYYSANVLQTAIRWPVPHDSRQFFTKADRAYTKTLRLISCYHGKLKFQIDADGRVVTCWAHNDKDAPNVRTLGVRGALDACRQQNTCEFCAFLANNEHNALMQLSPRNILHNLKIQVADALKIGKRKSGSRFVAPKIQSK